MQMLKDRGYFIADSEITMSKEQFVSKYGENMKREDLVTLKAKINDCNDQIYIFFPNEEKVGYKTVETYRDRMHSEKVYRAILVVQQNLPPRALSKALISHVEVFQEAELLMNVKEYAFLPEHHALTTEAKKNLLERYTVKETQLPRIQVTDPIARYYGLERGQVVKIIQKLH